jgi:hypothetical protein
LVGALRGVDRSRGLQGWPLKRGRSRSATPQPSHDLVASHEERPSREEVPRPRSGTGPELEAEQAERADHDNGLMSSGILYIDELHPSQLRPLKA